MKDELSGQIMNEFLELKAKSYNYLKDNNDEDKKSKGTKNCIIKRKHKCRDYKNCSEAAQIGKKINYLQKNKFDVDSLKEDKKEFIKNNKPILKKTYQRFKNEIHEVINKIVLSSNDDEKMQSIDSIETYAYGTSKDIICKKEKSKSNVIIKEYENV